MSFRKYGRADELALHAEVNASMDTQTQNRRGEWVPSIPLPWYEVRQHCDCGRRFWTAKGYRGHYALEHILGLD